MPVDREKVQRLAAEFVGEANAAYGLYLDAITGFRALADLIEHNQRESGASDNTQFFYGTGAPGQVTNVLLHQTTQGILKQRVRQGGRHYFLIARWVVVLLYELWETAYRTPPASAAGVDRNSLQASVFGDLRILRHAVLHMKGDLDSQARAKLQVVPPPSAGRVDYHEREVQQIVSHVKAAIDELVVRFVGIDPAFRTIWHVT